MKKYNLPVILLKGLVLLPNNTLKLEFDSKNIDIDSSLLGFILNYRGVSYVNFLKLK